jgi:hypothetical protein
MIEFPIFVPGFGWNLIAFLWLSTNTNEYVTGQTRVIWLPSEDGVRSLLMSKQIQWRGNVSGILGIQPK